MRISKRIPLKPTHIFNIYINACNLYIKSVSFDISMFFYDPTVIDTIINLNYGIPFQNKINVFVTF